MTQILKRPQRLKLICSQLVLASALMTAGPVLAAGQASQDIGLLIDQFVKQKMAQLEKQMGVVINLSGRQRMLTQKMSKEILLIYLGIDPDQNRLNLGGSAIMFSDTLKGLANGDPKMQLTETTDPAILQQLGVVSGLWQSFSQYVLGALEKSDKVDRVFVEKLAVENLPLLREMNKAVYMYERAAGADLEMMAPVVNLSGRQRMLTQKMTKEFLLIAAGIDAEKNKANLKETIELFDRTLRGLRDGDAAQRLPGTPQPDIRAQLDIIEKHWQAYRPVLESGDYSAAQLQKVAQLNLPLLKEMNTAVKMYELVTDA